MKKLISFLTIFVFAFSLSIVFTSDQAFAAKKKKGGATLNLKARDGGSIIYGSVLNAKENEVKAKLPKNYFPESLVSSSRSVGVLAGGKACLRQSVLPGSRRCRILVSVMVCSWQ